MELPFWKVDPECGEPFRNRPPLSVAVAVFGKLLALGARFVVSLALHGLKPVDAPVLAGVGTLLIGVSALACYLPARTTTRVDPLVGALRVTL